MANAFKITLRDSADVEHEFNVPVEISEDGTAKFVNPLDATQECVIPKGYYGVIVKGIPPKSLYPNVKAVVISVAVESVAGILLSSLNVKGFVTLSMTNADKFPIGSYFPLKMSRATLTESHGNTGEGSFWSLKLRANE